MIGIDSQDQTSTPEETLLNSNKSQCSRCGFIAKNSRGLNIHLHTCNKRNNSTSNDSQSSSLESQTSLIEKLTSLRSCKRIMNRIPKGARKPVCEEYTKIILKCISDNSENSWEKLLTFTYNALQLPPKDEKRKCSLATVIRKNILNPDVSSQNKLTIKNAQSKNQLLRSAMNKLSDGDIKGSVRILSSDEVIAPYNVETLESLIQKHPKRLEDFDFVDKKIDDNTEFEQSPVTRAEIMEGIRSFDNGSAGGIDGLRPQHLKDIVSYTNGHSANQFVDALGRLTDIMLSGKVPAAICPILYGANLTALMKKTGGIRPIAVGNTIRRLSAKISCNRIRDHVSEHLRPHQMGFAVRGGAEAIVHSARDFLLSPDNEDCIMVKLDYSNAFNSIFRAKMIQAVKIQYPKMFAFISQCYSTKSYLCYGNNIILSEEGVQQGDPLGPLLFCIMIQPIITNVQSKMNEWYLDDGSIGDSIDTVINDIKKIKTLSDEVGLQLNPSKCEVLRIKPLSDKEFEKLNEIIPGIVVPSTEEFCLLGAPLTVDAIPPAIAVKTKKIALLISRLDGLPAHQALFILKNCLAIPRMMHLLRSSPCWLFKDKLNEFDKMIKLSAENITNVKFDDDAWLQCSLPIKKGGLGLILTTDVASSAFISSMYSTEIWRYQILAQSDELLSLAMDEWKLESSVDIPNEKLNVQKSWSSPIMEKKLADLFDSFENNACQKARLLAVSQEESGLWLSTLPSTSLGLCLDNDSLRISVALRIGASICHPHTCICGKDVDTLGYHGLSCKKCLGRHPRHHAVNETIRRALVSAGTPAILEPPGVVREDGRHPDGLTLIPWSVGKCLLWDATIRDTVAKSYVQHTSKHVGWVANTAEEKKISHYQSLIPQYFFIPVGFETFGPWGTHAKKFISDVGKKISSSTNEKRATLYLKQRLSMDIQRGNAASVLGTMPSTHALDEVYYLLSNQKH